MYLQLKTLLEKISDPDGVTCKSSYLQKAIPQVIKEDNISHITLKNAILEINLTKILTGKLWNDHSCA